MSYFNSILKFLLFSILTLSLGSAQAFINYDEWEGDVSSDWNDSLNWEGNTFPTTGQAARVGQSAYTYAAVISSNSLFTPRYLMVVGGDTLTVSADLAVDRGMYVGGGAKLIVTAGTLSNTGTRDLNIRNEDTEVIVDGGDIDIGDDVYIDRLLDIVPGADPTLRINSGTFDAGGDLRFDGILSEQPKLIVDGGVTTFGGSIFNDGADVNIEISSGSLVIGADLTMSDANDSLIMSGGTITFSGSSNNITNNGLFSQLGGTTVFNTGDYDFGGTGLTYINNLQTAFGMTLTQSIASINLRGHFLNSGAFDPDTHIVKMNGPSSNQIIFGAGTNFYNLIINKSVGKITLSSNITIVSGGVLGFASGIIESDSSTGSIVIFEDGATSNNGNSTSYIDGYVRKIGDDDFIFPLGNNGVWRNITITGATGTAVTDVFEAEYVRGTHPEAFWDSLSYSGDPGGMYNVSILDYWKLYRTNGTAQPIVGLFWSDGDSSQIDNLPDLVVAHYTGTSTWEDLGGPGIGSVSSGAVFTTSTVNNFSPFTFGSTSNTSNPLPITLLEFKAESSGDVVQVSWTTTEEINNDYFTIERSIDGQNFHEVDQVEGAGNHSGELSYSFVDDNPIVNRYSYYRLKQTDFDGSTSYSNVDAVFMSKTPESKIVVFPNPVTNDQVFVNLPNSSDEEIEILIFDQLGSQVSHVKTHSDGDGLLSLDVPNVNGMYILKIITPTESYTSKVLVK